MKKQNFLVKYRSVYSFHRPYGRIYALNRMIQIFLELDLFDLLKRVNTRTIKYGKFARDEYMGYSPVYTSVCKEMIRLSHDYWLSGVRYSNYDMKTVFVDLGGGLGKPAILAYETNKFDYVFNLCFVEVCITLNQLLICTFKQFFKLILFLFPYFS